MQLGGRSIAVLLLLLLLSTSNSQSQSTEVQIDADSSATSHLEFISNNLDARIKSKPWSVLEEIFPNAIESIAQHWGKHPVYLPISSSPPGSDDGHTTRQQLVTIPNLHKQANRFSHLIKADDTLSILQNNPHLIHGKDYIVLKYLIRDGEEWNGQLPYTSIPPQEIANLLNYKAFSLVINNIDKHWVPIKDFAKSLETEILVRTTCNLYLTPPNKARAFESHIDWMDVIVLQLEGQKLWSVSNKPMIKNVLPDQKRKPTKEELDITPFEDILLQPGDALYIPRGYVHNATTTLDGKSHSLHLTFGIQYGYETTFEALLHFALHLYEEDNNTLKYSTKKEVISQISCVNNYKLTWIKLLHYSFCQLARQASCGGYAESSSTNNSNDEKKKGGIDNDLLICSLRESVPLHPQFDAAAATDGDNMENNHTEKKYQNILDAVINQVNALDAFHFMNSLTKIPTSKKGGMELGSYTFRYVGMDIKEPFSCNLLSNSSSEGVDMNTLSQDQLLSLAHDFKMFAKEKFHDIYHKMLSADNDLKL